MSKSDMKKILVTGAVGQIGSSAIGANWDDYDFSKGIKYTG